jgi:hypothetical protein
MVSVAPLLLSSEESVAVFTQKLLMLVLTSLVKWESTLMKTHLLTQALLPTMWVTTLVISLVWVPIFSALLLSQLALL